VALVIVGILAGTCWFVCSRWNTSQLLRQAEEALAAREYSRAKEHLARYLAIRPDDAYAHLLAARTARRLRDYYDAQEHLRRCRDSGYDADAISVEASLIDLQRGDESPVAMLRERAQKDDDLALVILEALIQYDLDTYQLWLALHELTRYLEHRPDDLQARLGRAFVWERFLYFNDALEDYRKAVQSHPDNEGARLHLADTILIAGTPAEALTEYQWLIERAPKRPDVRLGLARCRQRLGQSEEARKLLDELLAETPENGEVLWERGKLALEEGKAADAERDLRHAVKLLPHDRRVNYSLYSCLLALKSPEAEAVSALVAKLDTDLRRLDVIRQEVMKKPTDAPLRCEGGLIFLRNGERTEGIRWLRLALRFDPNCQAARKALAEAESATK
jgi:predicted Zn-dependent protease